MLRNATPDDIPACLALGEQMHDESPRFAPMRWNRAKVCGLMDWCIATEDGLFLVVERDGEIVGGFLGACSEHWCSDDRVAYDFALFVRPDERGGMAAARLLRQFVRWARTRGAAEITAGVTTGVRTDATTALYEAVGFRHVGNLFSYQGK